MWYICNRTYSDQHTVTESMRRILFLLCWVVAAMLAPNQAGAQVRYGSLRYDSLLHAMPEYAEAQAQVRQLREKYELEASYNEMSFKRMFAEFLQGQKDFPQNILLKRQRDLQDEMEKGLAFRREADSLLREAAAAIEEPVRRKLDAAIRTVGLERGYDMIVNLDAETCPFLQPALTEDATRYVWQKLYPQP